jgi:hypothetical protein
MTAFDTPEPISVSIELSVGDVRVFAGHRTDTVVEVVPSDPGETSHVQAAEQTRVDYAGGRLLVKAPRQRALGLFGKPGSVDVTIEVPAGSELRATAGVGDFRCYGSLGGCRIKTSAGDLEVEEAGPLDLKTGAGAVSVDRVAGDAEVSTGTGRVTVGEVRGTAVVKNSNGECRIGRVDGHLRVNNSNGDITVDSAQADVTARTASGDILVREVVRGVAELKTAYGDIGIGIRRGTAARLDVSTGFGRVRNELDATDSPGALDETADITAETSYGEIVIRRSGQDGSGAGSAGSAGTAGTTGTEHTAGSGDDRATHSMHKGER